MKFNSFYSLVLLFLFSLTLISCSHSGVRTSDADLSDEAVVAEDTSTDDQRDPIALLEQSGTPDEALQAEKTPSSDEERNEVASSDTQPSEPQPLEVKDGEVAQSHPEDSSAASSSEAQSKPEKSLAAPRKSAKPKNWQRVEKKPTAKAAPLMEEDRMVAAEIEKAIDREAVPAVEVLAPALSEKAKEPDLASAEVGSFAQRHSWFVAFTAAGLILFLFFTLTRNRAKKDMTL